MGSGESKCDRILGRFTGLPVQFDSGSTPPTACDLLADDLCIVGKYLPQWPRALKEPRAGEHEEMRRKKSEFDIREEGIGMGEYGVDINFHVSGFRY